MLEQRHEVVLAFISTTGAKSSKIKRPGMPGFLFVDKQNFA
jgi:hypothetical protein